MTRAILLIVEANPADQSEIKKLSHIFDCDAHTVSSCEEAIEEVARNNIYTLIVLNFQLQHIGRNACIEKLRALDQQRRQYTPVLAIAEQSIREETCSRFGVDDFLAKPYLSEVFRQMLLRWAYRSAHPNLKLLRNSGTRDSGLSV